MEKKIKVFIVVAGLILNVVFLWMILTHPAYDHSQDGVQAAEKIQLIRMNERKKEINMLSQVSQIINSGPINDGYNSYVVIKVVWDENLGTNRLIGERITDGHLHASMGKPGIKFVVGEKVKKIIINQILYRGQGECVSYFIPFPKAQ